MFVKKELNVIFLIFNGALIFCNNLKLGPNKLDSDLEICIGSSAAEQILTRYLQTELRNPRAIQMQLQSSVQPWFEPIAHIDSRNWISFDQLKMKFQNNYIKAKIENVTLQSASNIHLIPLPFFLGKDTAHVKLKVLHGVLTAHILQDSEIYVENCTLEISEVDIQLDNAYILNKILNPFQHYFMPKNFMHESACEMVKNSFKKLRKRFALEFPLSSIVPPKFLPYLLKSNILLFLQIESISTENDQLTINANFEWTETSINASTNSNTITEFNKENVFSNKLLNIEKETLETNNVQLTQPVADFESKNYVVNEATERLKIYIKDSLINELFEQFRWDFEWMEEKFSIGSPTLPQPTNNFLSILCAECYFLLLVKANGVPNIQSLNSSILLQKSEKIVIKVVNPTRKVDNVFVDLVLTVSVKLTPQLENDIFRTEVDLLNTTIRINYGAFSNDAKTFVEQMVKEMIMGMIWPNLKKKIENLSYADGVHIPMYCGLQQNTAKLHFESGKFGVTAALHLNDASLMHCLAQLKKKIPDLSKLFVIQKK